MRLAGTFLPGILVQKILLDIYTSPSVFCFLGVAKFPQFDVLQGIFDFSEKIWWEGSMGCLFAALQDVQSFFTTKAFQACSV